MNELMEKKMSGAFSLTLETEKRGCLLCVQRLSLA